MTYKSLKELFIAICDAIRNKEGSTEEINHQDIPARIRALVTSVTSMMQRNKKIQPSETENTIYPDDGYDGLSSVTVEAIPSTYIGSTIIKKEGFEYIPGTSDITIDENQYLIGAQIIKGDTDLISENIKSGVTIFNVEGSYVGSGTEIIPEGYVDTSSGTATSEHIIDGYIAWVDGKEIIGTHMCSGDGIDTSSDNPATENDIASGKEAYVNGKKITGNVTVLSVDLKCVNPYVYAWSDTEYAVRTDLDRNIMWRAGSKPRLILDKTYFGEAKPEEVLEGKTFTSTSGVQITGTYIPASSTGLDTSDATATSEDIAEGVTAYVNGEKIIGNVIYENYEHDTNEVNQSGTGDNIKISLLFGSNNGKRMIGGGKYMRVHTPASKFGNARPEDVASGVTFTSSKGLKLTGTATIGVSSGGYSSGDVVKAYTTSYTFTSGYTSGNITISYANNAGIDSNTEGKVVLKGDDTSGISSGLTVSSSASCDPVKGKYITVQSGGTISDVFYIPEDATFTYSGQSYSKTFSVDKCNKMFVLA